QRSGRPIDCGPAPTPVAAVTRPVVSAPTPTATRRMTRAQACADMAASGRQYVSASTGLPVQCSVQSQPVTAGTFGRQIQADLRAPQRAYTNPLDAAPGSIFSAPPAQVATTSTRVPYSNPLDAAPGTTFVPGANTRLATSCNFGSTSGAGNLPLRCGPQAQSPSGAAATVTVTRARTAPASQSLLGEWINPTPPPYSNPAQTFALPAPTVPSGYTSVWNDGRLNTQRGLPASAYQVNVPSGQTIRTGPQAQSPSGSSNTVRYATQPIQQQAAAAPAATRVVAPQPQRAEQISGHRYVQVGTFATRNEAQAIAQNLRARGLPMRVGVYDQQGREMRIVLAGPFGSDSQLQNALGTARGAGFSGAFTRR
ncbi:MAG: SPOR domain-containing protein, partial [Octadecabacter sp.]